MKTKWSLLIACLASLSFASEDADTFLERWEVSGDLRLRYEHFTYDDERPDRNRFRYLLRLKAEAELGKGFHGHFMLNSGDGSATVNFQSADDSFESKDLYLGQAYLRYKTGAWELGGGKLKNPFRHTDMVWDSDVHPEGVYQRYSRKGITFTLGQMILEEEAVQEDRTLLAGQFSYQPIRPLQTSLTYYQYRDGDARMSFFDALVEASHHIGDLPVSLKLDYAESHESDLIAHVPEEHHPEEDLAYGAYLQFGDVVEVGDWRIYLKYAHIEQSAVFPTFPDATFGLTDVEGWQATFHHRFSKHLGWRVSLVSVDGIIDESRGRDRIMLDFLARL